MEFKDYIEFIRPSAWATTVVSVSIGALLASHFLTIPEMLKVLITIMIIGPFLWSGLYTLNSIYDVEFDKQHPKKKLRALPDGRTTLKSAWKIVYFHVTLAFILAAFFNWRLIPVMLGMIFLQIMYDIPPFRAKDKIYNIFFSGPMNHLLRILAGYIVIKNSLAGLPWLFVLGMMFFYFAQYIMYKYINKSVFSKRKTPIILGKDSPKSAIIKLSLLVIISDILIILSITSGLVYYKFIAILVLTNFEWFTTAFFTYFKKLYLAENHNKFLRLKNWTVSLSLVLLIIILLIL